MRCYDFEIAGRTWIVSEGPDLRVNGRAVTEWEVRKVCEDQFGHEYYHQRGNAHIARRATEAQIRDHIARVYVYGAEEDRAA